MQGSVVLPTAREVLGQSNILRNYNPAREIIIREGINCHSCSHCCHLCVWVMYVELQPWPGYKDSPPLAGERAAAECSPSARWVISSHGPDSLRSRQRGGVIPVREGMLVIF